MISAKLIEELKNYGFELDFPRYYSIEELISQILKQKNQRLYAAIPLLLRKPIDMEKIQATSSAMNAFKQIILITKQIYKKERIDHGQIDQLIKMYGIKGKIPEDTFNYYHSAFKIAKEKKNRFEDEHLKTSIGQRQQMQMNQALETIYAPAKIRILKNIFEHKKLTNTELKYYYKAIRPISKAILNETLRDYLRIIESVKKER
ncbi:MAG: hypothetical protein QF915_05045 [Candidatus Woesearchaeota archaeon]|jgi:hypothetical protein|nr:hypothetical protein [Candidatus Woesearchaeota archaeon]